MLSDTRGQMNKHMTGVCTAPLLDPASPKVNRAFVIHFTEAFDFSWELSISTPTQCSQSIRRTISGLVALATIL